MLTSKRIGLAVAAIAVVATGTSVALGLGGEDQSFDEPATLTVKAQRVDAPSVGSAKGIASAAGGGTKVVYKEVLGQLPADTFQVVTIRKCKRGQAAINGYHARLGPNAEGAVEHGDLPGDNIRRWSLGIDNVNTEEIDVIFGLICLKP